MSKLLEHTKIKVYPPLEDFMFLKNKYNEQIKRFYSDVQNNKIAYIKYIREVTQYQSVQEELKKFSDFEHLIIIGIGGIINGAKAIIESVGDRVKKEHIFIDNVGFQQFNNLKKLKHHINPEKDVVIIVSKSGTTLETLIEFSFFVHLIPAFLKSKRIIVMTSEKGKLLDKFAQQNNLYTYYLPRDLGGRFSHFYSSLIPSVLLGINHNIIISSARKFVGAIENNRESKFLHFALNLFEIIKKLNISNIVILNYIDKLNSLGEFCVQLWDESLGKINKHNVRFHTTMVNALCPKEQHSQLQAFLEGKHDKLLFFLTPSQNFQSNSFDDNLFYKRSFNIGEILHAQGLGVLSSFIKEEMPIVWFEIEQLNEEFSGEFLAFFTLLVIVGAYLNELNPFNQDAVELYKNLTNAYLKISNQVEEPTFISKLTPL